MDKSAAPQELMVLTKYSYKTQCSTRRCSCKKATEKCTDACKCTACENRPDRVCTDETVVTTDERGRPLEKDCDGGGSGGDDDDDDYDDDYDDDTAAATMMAMKTTTMTVPVLIWIMVRVASGDCDSIIAHFAIMYNLYSWTVKLFCFLFQISFAWYNEVNPVE